ncbi:MAG: uracil-DNA glycosylase [Clostridiales bacterium]|nr:uracil-DNA glycosylase [Clostridiales bacterium]
MIKITKNWYELLKEEFEKSYFQNLQNFLDEEYSNFTIYPKVENIFNALNKVKYDDVKVVIIGQDPYHEPNQAHGLSFSVESDVKLPPSLQNIYKEIKNDLGIEISKSGNLTCWAKQGVLLLNTVLTVRRGQANSHKDKGWETLTSKILEILNKREKPIVFLLWGNSAKKIGEKITNNNHLKLFSAHPSPLSAYNGFFGCKHFSKTNEFLEKVGQKPIDWSVT